MRKIVLAIIILISNTKLISQTAISDSLQRVKDSTLHAALHADSVKVDKQFAELAKWERISAAAQYPLIKGGDYSGVIPVSNITEMPDNKMEYKLLFEVTFKNPDSVASQLNYSLVEIARIINLHVAAGVPLNKIKPVIVVHAGALTAICNNDYYKQHNKKDNPNLSLINDLEKKAGAQIVACGQAMTFFDIKKEDLLPKVKVAFSAKTTISTYELKGYVLYDDREMGKQ